MELSLREWLIIGGVIVIALIIIDGWRRMRSNRNTLRMQIDKSLVDIPDETNNPELPNGGFRVLDDPDHADFVEREITGTLASEVESELPPESSTEFTADPTTDMGELASEVNSEAHADDYSQSESEANIQELTDDTTEYHHPEFNATGADGLSAPRIVPSVSTEVLTEDILVEETFAEDALIEDSLVENSFIEEGLVEKSLAEKLSSEFVKTEPVFTETPQDEEVNFESLGDVRYATEYETQPDLNISMTDAKEALVTEAPMSFSASRENLSDDQVTAALDGAPSQVEGFKSQAVVDSAPAFDADSFAERDPLFEPLENVDDDLYDYDGVSAPRVIEEPASADLSFDTSDVEAETAYQFEKPVHDVQAEFVNTDTPQRALNAGPGHYPYDEDDIDDLSQGAEEFISPRLTNTVEEDDHDSDLDFEKPITELFGHNSVHASGPQQATMDLGGIDSISEQKAAPELMVSDTYETEESIKQVSRFNVVDDADDDLSHAPLIGGEVDEPELVVEQPVIERHEPSFTDIEPEPMYIDPSMDMANYAEDELPEEMAESIREKVEPISEASIVPESPKRSIQAVPDADKVLVISVVTREEVGFNGRNLLQIVKACGMHFGEMQIFNRYEDGFDQGAIQFSMTNAMEPGVFDIDNMESLDTRGVTFFMSMEEPRNVMNAYECMLGTAEAVAKNLGGELLDENRSSMRTQTKEHYRERIRHYEMRKLKPQL